MRQTISYSVVLVLKYIYNILPLEDIYKANGHLKMFCNVLANIEEHYVGTWMAVSQPPRRRSHIPFSSFFLFFFCFPVVTKTLQLKYSLSLVTYTAQSWLAGKANWPFFLFFFFFSSVRRTTATNPSVSSYHVERKAP